MKSEHSKQKPFILITNDDSVDSPLLAILIEALKFNNDLLVVAPAEEQSWKGKSMTRRGLIEKKKSLSETLVVGLLMAPRLIAQILGFTI